MTTKELIKEELDHLTDDELARLLATARALSSERTEQADSAPSLFAKLKQVKIEGPEDFAANLDSYLNGERRVDGEPDLR
ncbi:MAG TPA: hypothetical protein VN783_10725 [Thermoanaerobaculia bacterium]|nr:hypothetical protein [Thermoanaerobaculia bacterium]